MNILDIENKKNLLTDSLNNPISSKQKALLISFFFQELLEYRDKKIIQAFISEFIEDFLNYLDVYDPFCLHPKYSKQIIDLLENLSENNLLSKQREKIKQIQSHIKSKLKNLESILEARGYYSDKEDKTFFPVLEKQNFIEDITFGSLESLTIRIEDAKSENKFIISPREIELEKKIAKQINDSWDLALYYCKKYTKRIRRYHRVFIHYDKMQGVYIGNSLGIALTLGFIEELLKKYNAPTIVELNDKVAFTGSIDKNGNTSTLSQKIIEDKVNCIFFSPIEIFVLPRDNEKFALIKINQLEKEFPERKLEIVGVNKMKDLLNRRDLVKIRKQNPVVRVGKAVKKNSLSFTFAILLITVIIFSGLWDFDDNPAIFENRGQLLFVKNSNAKVLWQQKMEYDPSLVNRNKTVVSQRIIDINEDGLNEVILCCEELLPDKRGRIVCYNRYKEVIWEYKFRDTISTFRSWSEENRISIIDTLSIEGRKIIFLIASNQINFSSAVFKLDLHTGKRVDSLDVFWNAGGIAQGILGDFDNNKVMEIVCFGINNGYERSVLFSIDVNKIYGQGPAPKRYTFNRIPQAELNEYILLPKTDYAVLDYRFNYPQEGTLKFYPNSGEFHFVLYEGVYEPIAFDYGFTNKLDFKWVDCGDDAQQKRDSLVEQGVVNKPFTNTSEYFQLLADQIRYWDGGKFVKKEN